MSNNTSFLNNLISKQDKDSQACHYLLPNASGPDPEEALNWMKDTRDLVWLPLAEDPEEAFPDEWLLLNKVRITREGDIWVQYRRLAVEPTPVGPYFNRQNLSRAEMCDFSELPADEQAWWHNFQDDAEKITAWDHFTSRVEEDGETKERLEYYPNWDHLNASRDRMDDLQERLIARIEKVATKRQFYTARAYLKAQARAGILRKQGMYQNKKKTEVSLLGLNYARYALCWNILMKQALQHNLLEDGEEPKFMNIREYKNAKKKELTDALDAPRFGCWVLDTERFAYHMDATKESVERYSTLFLPWSSKRYQPTPKHPYFRLSTSEILSWLGEVF